MPWSEARGTEEGSGETPSCFPKTLDPGQGEGSGLGGSAELIPEAGSVEGQPKTAPVSGEAAEGPNALPSLLVAKE